MDTNCHTDCEALGEVTEGIRPTVSPFGLSDNCPRTHYHSTNYPAIQLQLTGGLNQIRNGSSGSKISLNLATTSEVNRPLLIRDDTGTIAAYQAKFIDGRLTSKGGLFSVSGSGPLPLIKASEIDSADSTPYILGGSKSKQICGGNNDCPCGGPFNLGKIPTGDVAPPAILAVDDSSVTEYMAFINIPVLTNDTGTSLTVVSVETIAHGTLDIELDGTITYTPAEGTTGDVTFTYTIQDSVGQTDTATVTVTVGAPPPIEAVNNSVELLMTDPLNIDVLTGDTGTGLFIDSVSVPTYGTAVIEIDDTITYTPSTTVFAFSDEFTYTIEDSYGQQDTANVTIALTWATYWYLPSFNTVVSGSRTWTIQLRRNSDNFVLAEQVIPLAAGNWRLFFNSTQIPNTGGLFSTSEYHLHGFNNVTGSTLYYPCSSPSIPDPGYDQFLNVTSVFEP